jgi:hypothetical protein
MSEKERPAMGERCFCRECCPAAWVAEAQMGDYGMSVCVKVPAENSESSAGAPDDEEDEDPTAGFTYCIEKGTGWE